MSALRSHVGVQAGNGLVARVGPVVLLAPGSDSADSFTAALVAVLDRGVDDTGDLPVRDLAWRLVDAVRSHPSADNAFGAVIATPDGYAVLLHGRARASVDSVDGALELRGDDALTVVDHLVTEPMIRVTVTFAEGPVAVDARLDLRDGLVPGCGFVLTSTADADAGVAAAPDRTSTEDVLTLPEPPQPRRKPVLETSLVAPVPDVLLSDEGQRTLLDRPYVFGREPHIDAAVERGAASPVQVHDPDNLISRVQAHVWREGDDVLVRDANSANGTFVAAPGAADWTRLGRDPAPLPLGWSLRMGRRTFTHVDGER